MVSLLLHMMRHEIVAGSCVYHKQTFATLDGLEVA